MTRIYNAFLITCILSFTAGISQEAQVSTFTSNFPGNGAVSVASNGYVFVSEYGQWAGNQGNGTRVFKLDPNGKVVDTITGLRSPMGTAEDRYGNLFVNNDNNMERGQILKITPEGKRSVHATIQGWPSGMNIDAQDNLYIPNYNKGVLHKITPSGEVVVLAEDKRLLGCTGIDFDSKGNCIVSNFATSWIYSISPEGTIREITQIPDITINNFGIGYSTVIDDVIYATGIAVNKVFKVTLDGNISVINTNENETAFKGPNGIRGNKETKTLYISEYSDSKRVQKIELKK